jgi:hypothetical protein
MILPCQSRSDRRRSLPKVCLTRRGVTLCLIDCGAQGHSAAEKEKLEYKYAAYDEEIWRCKDAVKGRWMLRPHKNDDCSPYRIGRQALDWYRAQAQAQAMAMPSTSISLCLHLPIPLQLCLPYLPHHPTHRHRHTEECCSLFGSHS